MSPAPPPFLRRLLARVLPAGPVRDGLLGDLDELYAERLRRGRARAQLWYVRQVLSATLYYRVEGGWRARGVWRGPLDGVGRDLVHALRTLRNSPGFTATAAVTLGLGIGAQLTLHGYARMARPGPAGVEAPETLVLLGEGPPACVRCTSMSGGSSTVVRERARSFEHVSLFLEWEPTLRGTDSAELLDGLFVTPDIFATLGVRPLLGRLFGPDDGLPGSEPVVVLSEAAWKRRLGADSAVIGRTVILDRAPFTVVGVAPAGLVFPDAGDPTEVWAPLPRVSGLAGETGGADYQVVARLRQGVTVPAAATELAVLGSRYATAAPELAPGLTWLASPLVAEGGPGAVPVQLSAAVGLLMLIACINLTGLLAARLSARRRGLEVRLALGAPPLGIVRQLLVETTVIGALGGLAGLLVSLPAARALLGPAQALQPRALGLALALGLTSGLLVGTWPAVRSLGFGRLDGLAAKGRSTTRGIDATRTRRGLIVIQIALATTLLSACGLLTRSFIHVLRIDPGFDTGGMLALRVWDPPGASPGEPDEERADRLVQALGALPGVDGVGAALGLPFTFTPEGSFAIDGRPPLTAGDGLRARMQAATPGYFAALGIPLLRGRVFESTDGPEGPRVAVLDEAAAGAFFPDGDALGRGLLMDGTRWEVVGVVGSVFHGDQERPLVPEIYRPMRQWPRSSVWITLRARGDPASLASDARAAVRAFDPDVAITNVATMDALRAGSMSSETRMLRLMASFALAAIVMSAFGLYGLVSYSVGQRTRELGLRKALGATASATLRLVLAEGLRLAAAGAALGLLLSMATAGVMDSLLYGVTPTDPLTLAGVVSLVVVVALLAAWIPARRATRVDPLKALGVEG